ncbi:uncharacterized protein CLIB1423_11S01728 [[Candida] railenensis]|uniref:NAD-dependent epimerase/dehydratase domain-containing protein n=1 Tax=[Candida] railenensis TaxID=45579 RepID=A0A9P0QRE0_9ASCO|nr:uncharacterized protein CLIB1423_11S01728 [[Candida] railenensis]
MKVFITGASGFIGTQVVHELLAAGHEVVALARSDVAQAKVEKISSKVAVLRGDLTDVDILKKGASESDGVVHLGFVQNFSKFEECCQIDYKATIAMLDVLEGTDKPFIYTSGTIKLDGKVTIETDQRDPKEPSTRGKTETLALGYKDRGVRVTTVRLPLVHGEGDHGFVPLIFGITRTKGFSAYIEEGSNKFPAVHVNDAAVLYRLVLEKGQAGHAYHAAAEGILTAKDFAEAIGKSLNVPVESITQDKVMGHFGFLGIFFGFDQPTSSEITREELQWDPKGVTLFEDINTDFYRNSTSTF